MLIVFLVRRKANSIGMLDHLREIIATQSVENCEKVISTWTLLSWVAVREVLHQLLILYEEWIYGLDREFVELGDVDESAFSYGHQLLLIVEDLLQEVLVAHLIWRSVELETVKELADCESESYLSFRYVKRSDFDENL